MAAPYRMAMVAQTTPSTKADGVAVSPSSGPCLQNHVEWRLRAASLPFLSSPIQAQSPGRTPAPAIPASRQRNPSNPSLGPASLDQREVHGRHKTLELPV